MKTKTNAEQVEELKSDLRQYFLAGHDAIKARYDDPVFRALLKKCSNILDYFDPKDFDNFADACMGSEDAIELISFLQPEGYENRLRTMLLYNAELALRVEATLLGMDETMAQFSSSALQTSLEVNGYAGTHDILFGV